MEYRIETMRETDGRWEAVLSIGPKFTCRSSAGGATEREAIIAAVKVIDVMKETFGEHPDADDKT